MRVYYNTQSVLFAVLVDNVEKITVHYISNCRLSNTPVQPIPGTLLNQNGEKTNILLGPTNFWENTTSCGESDNLSRELVNRVTEK